MIQDSPLTRASSTCSNSLPSAVANSASHEFRLHSALSAETEALELRSVTKRTYRPERPVRRRSIWRTSGSVDGLGHQPTPRRRQSHQLSRAVILGHAGRGPTSLDRVRVVLRSVFEQLWQSHFWANMRSSGETRPSHGRIRVASFLFPCHH